MNQSLQTLTEVKARYEQLRALVYEFTDEEFQALGIACRAVSFADAMQADRWRSDWKDNNKVPCWEWVRQFEICQASNGSKRFELALCHAGKLVALCYGMPSKRKLLLKIHSLARNPNIDSLAGQIFPIVLFAANAYARLLGCKEIQLIDPMNQDIVLYYERFGFIAERNRFGQVKYLAMEVGYGR